MTLDDAYRVLNVAPGADPAQVRQAYLDLVKVWHPDRFGTDERLREKASRTLQDVNEAYRVLQSASAGGASASAAASHGAERPAASSQASTSASSATATHDGASVSPAPASAGRWRNNWVTRRNLAAAVAAIVAGVAVGIVLVGRGDGSGRPDSADVPALDSPETDATAPDVVLPRQRAAAGARTARTAPPAESRPAGPETGTELRGIGPRGRGAVVFTNSEATDAVALLESAEHGRAVYVRRGEKVTLLDLPPGDYRVRVMLGREWAETRFAAPSAHLERSMPLAVVPGLSPAPLVIGRSNGDFRATETFILD